MSTSPQSLESSEQIVVILVGLIASGKSTFAQALEHHFPRFRRCNQDDLGNRRKVENLARESLGLGLSVCIDRTNINAEQRAHWIKIAREFGACIWVIVFDTPYDVCAARLQNRTSHPTITTPELGLRALSSFSSSFQEPHPQEGHERLLVLRPSDHSMPTYNHSDISTILQRLRESPPVLSSITYAAGSHSRRVFGPGYPRGSQGCGEGSTGNSWRRGTLSGFSASVRGQFVDTVPASMGGTENLVTGTRPVQSSGSPPVSSAFV